MDRDQEKEKLSWGNCSWIFHRCTKGQEKLISDKDMATSNLASRDSLKWVPGLLGTLIDMQWGGRGAWRWLQPSAWPAGLERNKQYMSRAIERKTVHMWSTPVKCQDGPACVRCHWNSERSSTEAPQSVGSESFTCCLSVQGQVDALRSSGKPNEDRRPCSCAMMSLPGLGLPRWGGHKGCRLMAPGTFSSHTRLKEGR